MASSRVSSVMTAIVCIALGASAAIVGAFIHSSTWVAGGRAWSIGVPLALALAWLVFALAAQLGSVFGAWIAGSTWVLSILVLSWPRAQGDIVIPGTWYGYTFMLVGMVLAFAVVARTWWVLQRPTAGNVVGAEPVAAPASGPSQASR